MAMPIPMPDAVAHYRAELESQRHPAPTKATASHFGISERQVRRLAEEFRINSQRALRAAAAVAAPVEERQPPESAAVAAPVEERQPPTVAAPRQLPRLPSRASRRHYRARAVAQPAQLDKTLPTPDPVLESLLSETPVPAPPVRPVRERPAPPVRPTRPAIPRDLLTLCAVGVVVLVVLLAGRVLGFSYRLPRPMVLATAVFESSTVTRTTTALPTLTASLVPPSPTPAAPTEPPTMPPTEPPPPPTEPPPPPVVPTGWCADDGVTITCFNGAVPPPVAPLVIPPSPTIAPYQATEQAQRCAGMAADSPCWNIRVLSTPTQ